VIDFFDPLLRSTAPLKIEILMLIAQNTYASNGERGPHLQNTVTYHFQNWSLKAISISNLNSFITNWLKSTRLIGLLDIKRFIIIIIIIIIIIYIPQK